MKKCSCGKPIVFTAATYIGSQVFPGSHLAMFNCLACGSTAAVTIAEADDDDCAQAESEAA